MAVRRSRFHQRSAGRMNRYWITLINAANGRHNIPLDILTAADVAGTVLFKNSVSAAFEEDITVARIFMPYSYTPPATAQVNAAVGIAIVSPGSIISVVNPITDAQWDGWMLHQWLVINKATISFQSKAPATSGNASDPVIDAVPSTGTFDVKAKRKIPQGSTILVSWAIEATATLGAADTFSFNFGARALFMEK